MSLSLVVRAIPVEPPPLDDAQVDDWVLLDALNLGEDDQFCQTTKSTIREHPVTIVKHDRVHTYLLGMLRGMDPRLPAGHEVDADCSSYECTYCDRRTLAALVRAIDVHGGVQVIAR